MTGKALELTFETMSRVGRRHPRWGLREDDVEVLRDIPYFHSGDPAHLLDVYRPRHRSGPLPIVLYVHGGGFRILSKDTHWVMGLTFAKAGYLVFNVNYRLAPRHPFPAALEDLAEAAEFVVDSAASYGGDLERVVLSGESAGANLALTMALAASFERHEPYAGRVFQSGLVPRAVVPFCGLLDVHDSHRYVENERLPRFVRDHLEDICLGYMPDEDAPSVDLASPVRLLEQDETPARPLPPMYSSAGTKDPILDDTRRLERALRRREIAHRVDYYRGEPHAFQAMVFRRNARRSWRACLEFLEEHV